MNRRHSRAIFALAGTAVLVTTLTPPAHAAFATVPGTTLTVVKSQCSPGSSSEVFDWWGMAEDLSVWSPRYIPSGTMEFCMYKYRILDNDPNFDYYAITLQSFWTRRSTEDNDDGGYPAVMNQSVYSNWAAREGVFSGTPTYTSNSSCSAEVEVSFAVGPFGIGTSHQACSGETISRISLTERGAAWSAPRVGRLTTVETSYAQKIPQGGSVPLFDVQFRIPQYTSQHNGTVWDYTPAWRNLTYPRW
jgi:hypothetical protein